MHTRALARIHTHIHTLSFTFSLFLNASTYFASGKGRKMQRTSPHTYVLAHSHALTRVHTQAHTHILHTHTLRHVHIHAHPRSRNASLHERKEILTSNLKTKHATYADMYTCTRTHALNALALRFRKGRKG